MPTKSPPKSSSKLAPILESGTDQDLEEWLLAHPTVPDASWSARAGRSSRKSGESRSDFIDRVLGG